MQLNAEDASTGSAQAGKRKFIMVQLPEACDEKSEAFKAGYQTIAEIGKERIRRAGKKILNALGVENLEGNSVGEALASTSPSLRVEAKASPTQYLTHKHPAYRSLAHKSTPSGHRLPCPENRQLQYEGRLLHPRRCSATPSF